MKWFVASLGLFLSVALCQAKPRLEFCLLYHSSDEVGEVNTRACNTRFRSAEKTVPIIVGECLRGYGKLEYTYEFNALLAEHQVRVKLSFFDVNQTMISQVSRNFEVPDSECTWYVPIDVYIDSVEPLGISCEIHGLANNENISDRDTWEWRSPRGRKRTRYEEVCHA